MKSVAVNTLEGLDLEEVETLTFGYLFNQPIERLDLKGVTSLTFGYLFNQPIEGLDLKGVTSLTFGRDFNPKVEGLDLAECYKRIFRNVFKGFRKFHYKNIFLV